MKSENIRLLNRIIRRKSTEFGWHQGEKSPQVVPLFAPRERFHLFIELDSPVVPSLPLQLSIQGEENAVRALLFPSPRLLAEQTAGRSLRTSTPTPQGRPSAPPHGCWIRWSAGSKNFPLFQPVRVKTREIT